MSLAPSYIRFEETCRDLDACMEHMWDKLSAEEHECRIILINLCREIAEEFPDEDAMQGLPFEKEEEDESL